MRIPLTEQGHNLTYIINNLITYLPNRMRKWQFWKIMKQLMKQFPDPYFWDTPYKNRSYEIRLRFSWFWSNLTWKSNFKRRFELRLFLSYGLMGPKPLWSRIWIFTSFSYEGVPKISRLTNCRFKTISGQIFHKTEVQTVILSAEWVYLNWYKSYDKNEKHAKITHQNTIFFVTKWHKNENGNNWVLCHNFWTNFRYRPIQHLKMIVWTSVLWKIFM